MTPYCVSTNDISQKETELLREIRSVIERLPDLHLGQILSCHLLARAIGQVFDLRWVDGYFYPSYQHSWLLTKRGNILDVYPVAIWGGPIIAVGKEVCPNAPSRFHYKKKRIGIGVNKASFKKALRQLTREIRRLKNET